MLSLGPKVNAELVTSIAQTKETRQCEEVLEHGASHLRVILTQTNKVFFETLQEEQRQHSSQRVPEWDAETRVSLTF